MHVETGHAHTHSRNLGEAIAAAVHFAMHGHPHQRVIVIVKGVSFDESGFDVDVEPIFLDEDLDLPGPELLRKHARDFAEQFNLAEENIKKKHEEELLEWERRLREQVAEILSHIIESSPEVDLFFVPGAREDANEIFLELQNEYPEPEPDEPRDDMAA